MKDALEAPCAICGYNGPGYWQRETHSRDCPWHFIGGMDERLMATRALMPRMKIVNEQTAPTAADDRTLYGTSYERKLPDGTLERIDPKEIIVRKR